MKGRITLLVLFVLKLKPSVNLFALATVVCRKEEALLALFGVAANASDCSPTSSSLSPVLAVLITVDVESNAFRFRERDTDSIKKQERV